MSRQFVLRHVPKGEGQLTADFEPRWRTWETCLRRIEIVSVEAGSFVAAGMSGVPSGTSSGGVFTEVLFEEKAFVFLLEVVSGLHSPILGETEVFGQFKAFLKQQEFRSNPEDEHLKRVLFQINRYGKELREKHLSGLGSQSYGSLLRRHLKGKAELHVLGAGHLAQEILPWIQSEGENVKVWCRSPEKAEGELKSVFGKKWHSISVGHIGHLIEMEMSELRSVGANATLIVAAPLEGKELTSIVSRDCWGRIFDLRGEGSPLVAASSDIPVLTLSQLFEEVKNERHKFDSLILKVRTSIRERAREFFDQPLIRPFGWEDVCA